MLSGSRLRRPSRHPCRTTLRRPVPSGTTGLTAICTSSPSQYQWLGVAASVCARRGNANEKDATSMRLSIGISLASLITSACAIGWAAQFGWAADHGPVRVDHRNLPTRGCNRGEHPMMVFDREGNSCGHGGRASTRRRTASTWRRMIRCSSSSMAGISCARSRSTAHRWLAGIARRSYTHPQSGKVKASETRDLTLDVIAPPTR